MGRIRYLNEQADEVVAAFEDLLRETRLSQKSFKICASSSRFEPRWDPHEVKYISNRVTQAFKTGGWIVDSLSIEEPVKRSDHHVLMTYTIKLSWPDDLNPSMNDIDKLASVLAAKGKGKEECSK
ncbi:hypothetical protein HKX48_007921 [Thoreauomyces humboldtii]|nr:hypothetical protein HKX48_007921 [Thoreauomyces humboldtii]